MKLMAAVVITGGLFVMPMLGIGPASATPSMCDGAGCVPYVNHDAQPGGYCNQGTRYNFGMDSSGRTLACSSRKTWVSWPPLVGVRTLRSPCGSSTGAAQTPDGIPLKCDGGAWTSDFSVMLYG